MITPPTDPLFRYQWFLSNTGQSGGAPGSDINVLPVWPDYTGKGVRVAIVDDGVQLNQPDLKANIDLAGSWDAVANAPGGDAFGDANHGTAVAGLVGEVANNGIGGSGVAPDATLLAYRINLSGKGGTMATIAFQKALEFQAAVVSNSWGSDDAFTRMRAIRPRPPSMPRSTRWARRAAAARARSSCSPTAIRAPRISTAISTTCSTAGT